MNYCRRCESDYEKPGTCNCYAGSRSSDKVEKPAQVVEPSTTPAIPWWQVYPYPSYPYPYWSIYPLWRWDDPYSTVAGGGTTGGVRIGEGGRGTTTTAKGVPFTYT